MNIPVPTPAAWAAVLVVLLAVQSAAARNIDLATVPARDSVQLTIYNSEDLTLVRETRTVSFKRGLNRLQFSWANTLIDPSSVALRFPEHGERLTLLDTAYPHDKPQMLYWNVQSRLDGEATVEISYFTSGITWRADYVMITEPVHTPGEAQARVDGYVRVHNASGEDYPNARVRLVVGTINLVEKIAELARVPMSQVPRLQEEVRHELRRHVAESMMTVEPAAGAEQVEKAIIKDGLSEYFIYAIEGTETIPDGWSKRLRSFHADAVPLEVRYWYRPRRFGDRLTRVLIARNDEASGLGTTPLPDGTVRVFRAHADGALGYLAARRMRYVPIGDRLELDLGPDPRVEFELRRLRSFRDNIWFELPGAGVYRRLEDGRIAVDTRARVAGWVEHTVFSQRVRNHTPHPIRLAVRRSFRGDVEFRSRLAAESVDYRTVEYVASVPAGESAELRYEVLTRHGRNAEDEQVRVHRADVPAPVY